MLQNPSQEETGRRYIKMPTHLTCTCCGELKPIDQFSSNKNHESNYGKQYDCKLCAKLKNDEWKVKNPLRVAIHNAKRAHKRRKTVPKEFDIDYEYMKQFDVDVCPIMKIPMQWNIGMNLESGSGGFYARKNSKSLERLNPNRGYIKGNVIIISWRANELKKDGTIEELKLIGQWAESQTK